MNAATLLAQAAEADRAANAIFAKLDAAPKRPHPDGGCFTYPAGSAGEVQRACDLKRRASYLRADAAEIVLDSATKARAAAPAKAVAPTETNEIQTCTTPEARVAPLRPGVVQDPADAIAARILASDEAPEPGSETDADDVARRILEA